MRFHILQPECHSSDLVPEFRSKCRESHGEFPAGKPKKTPSNHGAVWVSRLLVTKPNRVMSLAANSAGRKNAAHSDWLRTAPAETNRERDDLQT